MSERCYLLPKKGRRLVSVVDGTTQRALEAPASSNVYTRGREARR